MKLTQKHKLGLTGALALALGLATGVVLDGDDAPTRKQKLEKLGDDIANGSALGPDDRLDVAQYNAAILEVRDADPSLVDLLTAPVSPGGSVTTGVSLPRGARIVGGVALVGPAQGSFNVTSVTHTDGDAATWLEVKATNTAKVARRLTAMVEVKAPP